MQSTLGAWLAAVLDVPHVPLDEVYWQPSWQPAAPDEFRTSVKAAMEKNDKGWVIDGEYSQAHGDMILREATDIICKYHCRLTVV
jgi:adenylate kinase family enzyme